MINEIIPPSVLNTNIRIFKGNAETDSFVDWHFHNEYELFLLYDGKKIFRLDNRVIELQKGDIIFVNRRIPHKTETFSGSGNFLIQFDDDFGGGENVVDKYLFELLKSKEKPVCVFRADSAINQELRECFEKIGREYREQGKCSNMYIQAYVFLILSCLHRHDILVTPDKLYDEKAVLKILPVLHYINNNYSKQINLDEMSRLLHMDKSYFCRLFKKAVKTSFINYLNYIKIRHAEQLLCSTEKNITETAFETGFSSVSYFTETFRKINLLSPTEYKRMRSEQ